MTAQGAVRGYPTKGYRNSPSRSAAAAQGYPAPTPKVANDTTGGSVRPPANSNPRLGLNLPPGVRTLGTKVVAELGGTKVAVPIRLLRRSHPMLRALDVAVTAYNALHPQGAKAPGLMKIRHSGIVGNFRLNVKWRDQVISGWTNTSSTTGTNLTRQAISPNPMTVPVPAYVNYLYLWGPGYIPISSVRHDNLSHWIRVAPGEGPAPHYHPPAQITVPGIGTPNAPKVPFVLIPHRAPHPLTISGYGQAPAPAPRQAADSSGHRYRPPRERERERKWTGSKGVLGIVNAVSEGVDFVEALYEGLPEKLRHKIRRELGHKPTPYDMAVAIAKHLNDLDLGDALEAIIKNQIEDRIYGGIGQQVAKANKRVFAHRGIPVGATAGPVDTAFAKNVHEHNKRQKAQERKKARDAKKAGRNTRAHQRKVDNQPKISVHRDSERKFAVVVHNAHKGG